MFGVVYEFVAELAAFFPGREMFKRSPGFAVVMMLLAVLTTLGVLGNIAGAILMGYWVLTSPAFIVGALAAMAGVWLLYWAIRRPKTAITLAIATVAAGLAVHTVWRANQLAGMPLYVETYQLSDGSDGEVARAAEAKCGAKMFTYQSSAMMGISLNTGEPGKPLGPYLDLFIEARGDGYLYSVQRADDRDPIDSLWRRLGLSDGFLALDEARTPAAIADGVCKIVAR